MHRPGLRRSLPWILPLLLGSWLLLAARRGGYGSAPPGPRLQPVRADRIEVLDGDTFRVEGELVRLLGADTPERAAPWFRGDQEPWGARASERSRALLDRAQHVFLLTRGERDLRGRLLAHLLVDGEPLAAHLVAEGLALPTRARYGDGGFPDQAEAVEASAPPSVPFQAPWHWRRAHRR